MPVDTGIYNAFLQPPKSALDYQNEFLGAQAQRQKIQQNAIGLQGAQASLADAQRVRDEQAGVRTALAGLPPASTPDDQVKALRALGTPTALTTADTLATSYGNQQVATATAKEKTSIGAKNDNETAISKHQQHLQALATVNSPQDAVQWVLDGVKSGVLPAEGIPQALQKIGVAAQTPGGLEQWRQQTAQTGQLVQQQLEMTTPKPTELRLGNVVKMIDTNPHSPTYGKEVVAPQAIGVSPDTATTNATTRRGQDISAATAKAGQQIEAVKADPYGTLGLNKIAPPSAAATSTLSGDDYLKTLPPAVANQVKMLSDGRMPITAQSARSPQMMQLLAMASQYEPGTDATTYVQRAQTVKDFAPGGKDGQSITNLNTAIHHAGQLSDAIDNLNNSNFAPGITNPVENYLGQKVLGQTTQGVYKQKADALSSELRKVYAGGGGGSLSELSEWQKSFDPDASQDQQRAYLNSGMELLVGALQAKKDAYERGMGPRAQFGQFVTPESSRVLTKLAPNFATQISQSTGGSPQPAAGAVPDDIAAILAKHGSK